jgi:biotin carboxylase
MDFSLIIIKKGTGIRMKAAIIGAGSEAIHTIRKAKEYGITVVALDGNKAAEGLREADKAMVVDISDEAATIEVMKQEKPDFVLTVPIGRYLTTIGAVNDALGLPGISKEMAVLCTDKFIFHQKLKEAGLRNCTCYALENEQSALADLPIAFPAILKPRYGSGSRGIHLVNDQPQLKRALEAVSGEPYVLEECIAGEEYGADGAVTEEGFQLVLLRHKENTPPPIRQAVGYFSVLPKEEIWQQAREYMEKVVSCLGLEECILHADLIRGEEGFFVIELSARPSGHNLHNLFTPLCTGVDLAEEYIKYRLGRSCSFQPKNTRPMMIHYFDMEGKVTAVPDREQIEQEIGMPLIAWECHIRPGEELGPVTDGHSLMGRGYFILEGEDYPLLKQQADKIKKMFFED